jgi:hypothetical protein
MTELMASEREFFIRELIAFRIRIKLHNQGSEMVVLRARRIGCPKAIDIQITRLESVRKGFGKPVLRAGETFFLDGYVYWTELV